ncbi:MAG: glutathione S-transferase family protein [Myxococcota bacterium]|nr:glutathione S-transferase family protein [Myxococcota bacterium]
MRARLITIPFSHFCEKARWGLDRAGAAYDEEMHAPGFHLLATKARGRGRATPVWIDEHGEVTTDSTAILLRLDERTPRALRLYPEDASERATIVALEEELDHSIGPAARRIAYHHLFRHAPATAVAMIGARGPSWQRAIVRRAPGLLQRMLDRALDLSEAATERSQRKLDAALERLDARLRDARREGRSWLSGTTFGAADLTLASLLSPFLAPPEHPFRYPSAEAMPAALRALSLRIAQSETGELVSRAYREERARRPGLDVDRATH